jgi:hypothetical protein
MAFLEPRVWQESIINIEGQLDYALELYRVNVTNEVKLIDALLHLLLGRTRPCPGRPHEPLAGRAWPRQLVAPPSLKIGAREYLNGRILSMASTNLQSAV